MSEENAESPGQYVLKKLFADFVHLSTSKLNFIATQDLEYVVTKCLQRGEDPYLDQVCLQNVSCKTPLPVHSSVLRCPPLNYVCIHRFLYYWCGRPQGMHIPFIVCAVSIM